jgi:hypothetical protein
MLLALYTIFILGGGGSGTLDFIADFGDSVKMVVENKEDQKAALATLKAMKKLTSSYDKDHKSTSKELSTAISSNDNATIDAVWDQHLQQRNAYDSSMLDLRFELRDQLTREEWQSVFPSN